MGTGEGPSPSHNIVLGGERGVPPTTPQRNIFVGGSARPLPSGTFRSWGGGGRGPPSPQALPGGSKPSDPELSL